LHQATRRIAALIDNREMASNSPSEPQPALEPEDYYFEGPNLVFTAAYHLKRGYCCNSGCRHCPYGFKAAGALAVPDPAVPGPAVPDEDVPPAG
jgi:hypothetical protein